jgi:hypothetical protein
MALTVNSTARVAAGRNRTLCCGQVELSGGHWEVWTRLNVVDVGCDPVAPLLVAHVGGEFVAQHL